MITKFSASIRRNQRQWMVVLTILAIFAFLFDDVVRGANRMSSSSNVFVIAALCAAGMCIIGYPRGKTAEFGIAGFVVGGLVAFIGLRASGQPPIVRTQAGNYTRNDLIELRNRRMQAEQFLMAAVRKVDKEGRAPSFGGLDDGSLVAFALMQKEVQRMGVAISDEAVNKYLQQVTQDRLTQEDYQKALREAGTSETELFEILRTELAVQLVGQLLSAPADYQPMLRMRIAQHTPEQLWQSFRKLHVRQALTAVAIPVSEFVKQVAEPSEQELREFFDRYKNRIPDEQGNPGFLELPKARLAYLAASNLEAYEKQVTEATDQEVVDYYLKNKERYRDLDLPDPLAPKLPGLKNEATPPDSADAPPDATKVENATEAKAESAATESSNEAKTGEKPAVPASPEKKEPAPSKEDSSKDASPCDEDPAAPKSESADVPEKDAIGTKTAESAPKADTATPPAPALPTDDVPGNAAATGTPALPLLNTLPTLPPATRYRELDGDLKQEIRETLLREKAFERMGQAADKALEFLMTLNEKYDFAADVKDRPKIAASFPDQLKKYAEEHGLDYVETKEMTRAEFETSIDEPIGSATDPLTESSFTRRSRSVVDEVFELDPSGRSHRLQLYSPRRADALKGSRYAYWKISEVPAKVPDLKDATVHQKVVDAWKITKARPLAEKRAKEIAELMKKGTADIAATLSGQTINGTPESPAVTIRETPKFSWLRLPQSMPQFGMQQPSLSTIEGIDQPGPDFMKIVFEDLGEGDTGVTLNQPRTAYYVARVHDRDAANSEADGGVALQTLQQQFLREQFTGTGPFYFPTPYDFLAAMTQQTIDTRWRADFNKRFGIVFEQAAQPAMEEE